MGLQTRAVIFSPVKANVWQQPGDTSEPEAANSGEPPSDHAATEPEVAPPAETNSASSEPPPLVPVGSSDQRTVTAEDGCFYDMHIECTDAQDDDYVLVALEPVPKLGQTRSKSADKGQEASED